MPRTRTTLAGLLGLALAAGSSHGQLPQAPPSPYHPQTQAPAPLPPVEGLPQAPAPEPQKKDDKPSLSALYACHTMARAGYPDQLSRCAAPSNTCAYGGYYVGGGCILPRKGGPPAPLEGTWGWDYFGKKFQRHVVLGFCHQCRYQGGPGSYSPDKGPHVPNVFAIKLPERPHAHCDH